MMYSLSDITVADPLSAFLRAMSDLVQSENKAFLSSFMRLPLRLFLSIGPWFEIFKTSSLTALI